MEREFFDGQVRHQPPVTGGGYWVDEWWGPGGYLVVTPRGRGHRETLTQPDGEVLIAGTPAQGADYALLPELMGEHWEAYQELVASPHGG